MLYPLCRKIYLELSPPGAGDSVADKDRIIRALRPVFGNVIFPIETFRSYYKLLRDFDWKLTVTLADKGSEWEVVSIEPGNTEDRCYGYAADLGSTTVIMQLVDLNSGQILGEESIFNNQIQYGNEILSRIFYVKDNEEHLNELHECTLENFRLLMKMLEQSTGISPEECGAMVISGNTTMIHFLLGFDPWFVFHTPYAPAFNSSGFISGRQLKLGVNGPVYCFPSVANYVGGDVISGLLESELFTREEISLYMDIGTNGEMVLGNNEFMLSAAGAAGPALEGGISRQGMQAKPGAVDTIKIRGKSLSMTVIGNTKPIGICGSGIVDLLAEMLLEGWIDFSGALVPGKSDRIVFRDGEYAVVYAWEHESGSNEELIFTQRDIFGFMDAKAAANTMVAYLLEASGVDAGELNRVYLAGAFGKHLNLESAITIGIYPDLPRDRFIILGNASLKGAYKLLTNSRLLDTSESIIEKIDYLSLGEATDFLTKMYAAKFLPHTNMELYPTVKEKLMNRRSPIQE